MLPDRLIVLSMIVFLIKSPVVIHLGELFLSLTACCIGYRVSREVDTNCENCLVDVSFHVVATF